MRELGAVEPLRAGALILPKGIIVWYNKKEILSEIFELFYDNIEYKPEEEESPWQYPSRPSS